MNALIVVASRHGGTSGIALAVRDELARHGIRSQVASPEDAPPPDGFDLVILGSAVYAGRWMDAIKKYAGEHAASLRRRPVHLFSSGPLGDPPKPDEEPADAAPMKALTGARGHATFAGRLDKEDLNLAEKAVARMVKAPYGDFRPWPRIAEWAAAIAERAKTREVDA